MENRSLSFEDDHHLNFKATELRLGLPGSQEPEKQRTVAKNYKRVSPEMAYEECRSNSNSKSNSVNTRNDEQEDAPPTKTQVEGWPPIRSYRKNSMQPKKDNEAESGGGVYVKVSVDGAPYLRKIDLKFYKSYQEFLKALENLFKLTIGKYSETEGYGASDYAPTYEDKDGDWMLVGDVPWEMFVSSCKRLRIMKGKGYRTDL